MKIIKEDSNTFSVLFNNNDFAKNPTGQRGSWTDIWDAPTETDAEHFIHALVSSKIKRGGHRGESYEVSHLNFKIKRN